jgi:hypothetical protein
VCVCARVEGGTACVSVCVCVCMRTCVDYVAEMKGKAHPNRQAQCRRRRSSAKSTGCGRPGGRKTPLKTLPDW